ncbi:M28 family peptidase [Pelomicrobium sp.]|jgi:hypothetical protein|uniref:M28 family peptidase n=1 Tax=Pelomicrobium sp. TaxID=2815319 RepID=UPI002FDC9BAB
MTPMRSAAWQWLGLSLIAAGLAVAFAVRFMTGMPGKAFTGPSPPLSAEERLLRDQLEGHVRTLAGEIGERSLWNPAGLEAAARYIRDAFEREGWQVSEQPYRVEGRQVRNIEAAKPGISNPQAIVLVGAHYDSLVGTPGANDNATGTAALLALARLLKERPLARTVRLVAFVNEEPPFFHTDVMGSRIYARRAREKKENIVAMLSLETIGYYTERPNSQSYPAGLGLFYPDTGNFLAFVSNLASRGLLRRAIQAFRESTPFPSEGGAVPGWVMGVSWSDHGSFWKEGYRAIMVTDTALFRYPYYHSPQDTPDKVDYEAMARIVNGLAHVVVDLADGDPF